MNNNKIIINRKTLNYIIDEETNKKLFEQATPVVNVTTATSNTTPAATPTSPPSASPVGLNASEKNPEDPILTIELAKKINGISIVNAAFIKKVTEELCELYYESYPDPALLNTMAEHLEEYSLNNYYIYDPNRKNLKRLNYYLINDANKCWKNKSGFIKTIINFHNQKKDANDAVQKLLTIINEPADKILIQSAAHQEYCSKALTRGTIPSRASAVPTDYKPKILSHSNIGYGLGQVFEAIKDGKLKENKIFVSKKFLDEIISEETEILLNEQAQRLVIPTGMAAISAYSKLSSDPSEAEDMKRFYDILPDNQKLKSIFDEELVKFQKLETDNFFENETENTALVEKALQDHLSLLSRITFYDAHKNKHYYERTYNRKIPEITSAALATTFSIFAGVAVYNFWNPVGWISSIFALGLAAFAGSKAGEAGGAIGQSSALKKFASFVGKAADFEVEERKRAKEQGRDISVYQPSLMGIYENISVTKQAASQIGAQATKDLISLIDKKDDELINKLGDQKEDFDDFYSNEVNKNPQLLQSFNDYNQKFLSDTMTFLKQKNDVASKQFGRELTNLDLLTKDLFDDISKEKFLKYFYDTYKDINADKRKAIRTGEVIGTEIGSEIVPELIGMKAAGAKKLPSNLTPNQIRNLQAGRNINLSQSQKNLLAKEKNIADLKGQTYSLAPSTFIGKQIGKATGAFAKEKEVEKRSLNLPDKKLYNKEELEAELFANLK